MQAQWLGAAVFVALFAPAASAGQTTVMQTNRANVFGVVQLGGGPIDVTQIGRANVAGAVVFSRAPSVTLRQSGASNAARIGEATFTPYRLGPGRMP